MRLPFVFALAAGFVTANVSADIQWSGYGSIVAGKVVGGETDPSTHKEFQVDFYDYIIGLRPQRVIFNPGTENSEFETMLSKNNIAFEEACTLVLLSTGQY